MNLLPGLQPLADLLAGTPIELPQGTVAEARQALHDMTTAGAELLRADVEPVPVEQDRPVPVDGGAPTDASASPSSTATGGP